MHNTDTWKVKRKERDPESARRPFNFRTVEVAEFSTRAEAEELAQAIGPSAFVVQVIGNPRG